MREYVGSVLCERVCGECEHERVCGESAVCEGLWGVCCVRGSVGSVLCVRVCGECVA